MSLTGLLDAAPIVMLIGLGVLIRKLGLLNKEGGLVLTRLAYYVTIPAAIFVSIARAAFEPMLLLLPLIGFILPTLLAAVMYLTTRRLRNRPRQRGPLMVGMVILGVFAYPFMELFYGAPGLARVALYDVGNAFFAGLIATYLARVYGRDDETRGTPLEWRKLLTSPLLLAALGGVFFSVNDLALTGPLGSFFDRLAVANTPLAMIAVGVFLRPQRAYGALVAQFVLIRMVLGGILGWGMALALGLDGLNLVVSAVASSLPAGTTVLVFSGQEGLDTELAASLVSFTLVAGIILVNILPHLLAGLYL